MLGVLCGFPIRVCVAGFGAVLVAGGVKRPPPRAPAFLLMANFPGRWLLLPRPPGAARFARGWGDFVAMCFAHFLPLFLPAPFRGHLFGGSGFSGRGWCVPVVGRWVGGRFIAAPLVFARGRLGQVVGLDRCRG